MFDKFKTNAVKNIFISTALFIFYIVFVAFPFLAANQPPNESTTKWAYDFAPVHYAMLYFPAFVLYICVVFWNLPNIKHIRKFIYPFVFIMLFIAVHMAFFVYSMIILWFCLITIPVGFFALIGLEIWAVFLDIKDNKQTSDISETQTNE